MSSVVEPDDQRCVYCSQAASERFQQFWGLDDRLTGLDIPDEFTLRQDLLPIGAESVHLLLLPKQHALSFASYASAATSRAVESVSQQLLEAYPDHQLVVFEHGPGFLDGQPIACGGCHVDHAHLHFVLAEGRYDFRLLVNQLQKELAESQWQDVEASHFQVDGLHVPDKNIVGIRPYLYVASITPNSQHTRMYIQQSAEEELASQLFRRLISDWRQKSSALFWHWRDFVAGLTDPDHVKNLQTEIQRFRQGRWQ